MWSGRFVLGFALLAGASATIFAQLPIPVQGQRGGAQGQQAPQGQRAAQLKKLYKDKKDYQTRVQQRYDELVKQGWALPLPMLRDVVIGDAAKVSF